MKEYIKSIFFVFGFDVRVERTKFLSNTKIEYYKDMRTSQIKDITLFFGQIEDEDSKELRNYIVDKYPIAKSFSNELFIILHEIGHLKDNAREQINIPQQKLLLSTIAERRAWYPREKRADEFAVNFMKKNFNIAKMLDHWRY